MAGILIVFGGGLAGLGFVLHQITPELGRVTWFTGLAGGSLSFLWGIAAWAGRRGRTGAVLTAVATAFALLSQVVPAWMAAPAENSGSLAFRVIVTAMMGLTMGMLMYLLHGERPPEFYQPGTPRPATPAPDAKQTPPAETKLRR